MFRLGLGTTLGTLTEQGLDLWLSLTIGVFVLFAIFALFAIFVATPAYFLTSITLYQAKRLSDYPNTYVELCADARRLVLALAGARAGGGLGGQSLHAL